MPSPAVFAPNAAGVPCRVGAMLLFDWKGYASCVSRMAGEYRAKGANFVVNGGLGRLAESVGD